jgi:hypothetical protein
MELAPLDEDAPPKISIAAVAEKPAAETVSEVPAPTKIEIKPAKPKVSLFEEEFEAARKSTPPPPVAAQRRQGEFDPLKPPGFVGPSYGTPAWVFVAIGVGVVAVIGVIAALVFGLV